MPKLVYGVGINDVPGSTRKRNPIYIAWYGMLTRCFSEGYKEKYPTYRGCTIDPEWLRYSTFSEWAAPRIGEGMCLDKDILLSGNKHYSPELCAFVPKWLNSFISNMKQKDRGGLPMGVQQYGNRFIARFGCRGTEIYLGSFKDAQSAHVEYMATRKVEVAKRIDTYSKMPGAIAEIAAALVQLFEADECQG